MEFKLFKEGNYKESLEKLRLLEKDDNFSIMINSAIVNFLATGSLESEKLLSSFEEIEKKINQQNMDKEHSAFCLLYNKSILLYQLKRYQSSLSVINKLFNNSELIQDNTLLLNISFLKLEIHLLFQHYFEGINCIKFIEKIISSITNKSEILQEHSSLIPSIFFFF